MCDRTSARYARNLAVALSVTGAGMIAGVWSRTPIDPHECSQHKVVNASSGTEPTSILPWS